MRLLILSFSILLLAIAPGLAGSARGEAAASLQDLRAAANAGDTVAQFHLAEKYRQGDGIASDPAAAAVLYRKAAEAGHATAQATLGGLYAAGIGVKQDFRRAYFWLIVSVVWGVGERREDAMSSLADVARLLDAGQKVSIARRAKTVWKGR